MHVPFLSLKDVTALHGAEINNAVTQTVNSGWYLQGQANESFEKNYANFLGTKHCIGCANGLDALIWIFRAYIEMGIMQAGDEVLVPANTYIASILAITENNLVPVLVEPNIATYQIDDSLIEKHITSKTKALMIVHLYGLCAYTPKIGELCKKHNLRLVEDNAQAHGCFFENKRTGSIGHTAGHSFYPGKNLGALGDAGAITTDDDELASIMRSLANYGSTKKYVFKYCGRNSRLDEIQAAVLDVKLKYLDADNQNRMNIAEKYCKKITNAKIVLPQKPDFKTNVFHIFPIRTKERDCFQNYLTQHDIQTIIHYPVPPHKQECYKQWNKLGFPITEQIHAEELSLPIGPAMSDDQVDYVIKVINEY